MTPEITTALHQLDVLFLVMLSTTFIVQSKSHRPILLLVWVALAATAIYTRS